MPGDVFRLSAGDLVPADARLLESRDLSVQQSMLTGESLPADKHASTAAAGRARPAPTRRISCSSARRSSAAPATALAIATGPRRRCSATSPCGCGRRAPETEFEHGLRRFSLLILRTTVVLVLFILLVGIAFKHDAFESLLFAVALGVGLTPEFLPMISSVTLTQGALRMARDQVIVKHLPAIQNFGSIDILCSDKTGTLTSGRDAVRSRASIRPARASPRPLTLAYINSRFETGIRSPLDAAILQQAAVDVAGYQKIDEIPFDFERRRLSVVVRGAGRRRAAVSSSPRARPSRSSRCRRRSKPAARSRRSTRRRGTRARRSTSA